MYIYKKKITTILVLTIILVFCIALVGCVQGTPEDTTPKEYVIQYADDLGMHTINVTDGMPYSLEVVPTREGYKFMGLYDAQVGGTQYVADNGLSLAPFTDGKNLVLFPQYRANDYSVVLDFQGAEVTGERQFKVAYDASLPQLPLNLTSEHKKFSGWYTEPNCQGVQVADKYGLIPVVSVLNNNNFDLSSELIYLYAGFEGEKYTVTCFFEAGIESEEIKVEYDTPVSQIVPQTRVNGKAPISWSKIQGGEVFTGKITGETVLYAIEYAPVIEFDVNGGKGNVKSIVARAGDGLSLPTPTRDNYKFIGWETTGGQIYNSSAMPTDSVKLTAKWQAMIVFDTNGGTDVTNISESQGTKITLPNTEKSGYMFAGWYDGNGEQYAATAMPSTSVKLYAKYWKIEKLTKVIVDESSNYSVYPSRTSPSVDTYCKDINLEEIYEKGVRNIVVTARYKSRVDASSSVTSSKPGYTNLTWYSTKSASNAYKLWQIEDKHIDNSWTSYTQRAQIPLTSSVLYLSFWCTNVSSDTWGNYQVRWTDFYIEIEYPDMSKLY